jgi:hypothetical protein
MVPAVRVAIMRTVNGLALFFAAIIVSLGIAISSRYDIKPVTPADGDPRVWRIDRWTGEVSLCGVYSAGGGACEPLPR